MIIVQLAATSNPIQRKLSIDNKRNDFFCLDVEHKNIDFFFEG